MNSSDNLASLLPLPHARLLFTTLQIKLALRLTMHCGINGTEGDQVERKSEMLETAYVKMAKEVLGYMKKKNKSWLSQETWVLVDQRKVIKQKLISARSAMAR